MSDLLSEIDESQEENQNTIYSTEEYSLNKIKKNRKNNNNFLSHLERPPSIKTKYVDVANGSYIVSSTAVITLLNGVGNGNDFYNRAGRLIKGKDLKISFVFTQRTGTTGWYAGDVARIMVVWDKEGDATPVISDFLLDVTSAGGTATNNLSDKNINNKERFIFLYDKNFALPSQNIIIGSNGYSVNTPHVANNNDWCNEIEINLDQYLTRFNGTGTTISSISTGALYFIVYGSVSVINSIWEVTASSRYSYFDS